ncbi:hypothetical protein HZS55_08315 [Halosimplex rubrum]|uniref:Uncharacterized protein n=1 Tax=Halosimplex rubrum TaxID=869889 RepID=A0A7D5TCG2_9EURY|nr:hypothetical protein [Halosimplex rubrum]QLH77296.1 hypothetical protein HZS55_08315 [Halosimplex rubrum]
MTVVVGEPTVDGSTVECEVTPSRDLRRFFTGDTVRVDYDADISDVPPAIASIPALAHVAPVAWANGDDVAAPAVDRAFLDALGEVGEALARMYPEFVDPGELRADEVGRTADGRPADAVDDSGLLFTGGVDSVASYVRHREAEPTLIGVQGWVVGPDEDDRWRGFREHVEPFADRRGLDCRYVRSNALSVLDTPMLQAHYKRYVDGAWYSSVGHGLGLLGLCAPLAHALGLGTVHIAASHTAGFDEPWGSHPAIDDRVRWGHSRGNHDGFELTRQKKIERIAAYVEETGERFPLRTCIHDDAGGNCNDCEKCYRTIVGLVLAGLDPNEFGYEADRRTLDEIRAAFERTAFVMDEHTRFHWEDIQAHVDLDRSFPVDGATDFFRWLDGVDMAAVASEATPARRERLARAVARNLPYPVYASLYPVYDALSKISTAGS